MDAALRELIATGVVGAVAVLLILGGLHPRWVVDYFIKKLAAQEIIIEKLTDALQRLADREEAKRK